MVKKKLYTLVKRRLRISTGITRRSNVYKHRCALELFVHSTIIHKTIRICCKEMGMELTNIAGTWEIISHDGFVRTILDIDVFVAEDQIHELMQDAPMVRTYYVAGMEPTCSICMDDFCIGDEIQCIPCNHHFHLLCISEWLERGGWTCPMCRYRINNQTVIDERLDIRLKDVASEVMSAIEFEMAATGEAEMAEASLPAPSPSTPGDGVNDLRVIDDMMRHLYTSTTTDHSLESIGATAERYLPSDVAIWNNLEHNI